MVKSLHPRPSSGWLNCVELTDFLQIVLAVNSFIITGDYDTILYRGHRICAKLETLILRRFLNDTEERYHLDILVIHKILTCNSQSRTRKPT